MRSAIVSMKMIGGRGTDLFCSDECCKAVHPGENPQRVYQGDPEFPTKVAHCFNCDNPIT